MKNNSALGTRFLAIGISTCTKPTISLAFLHPDYLQDNTIPALLARPTYIVRGFKQIILTLRWEKHSI